MFHSIENRSHQCLPWINLRMRIENFPIDFFDGHRLGLISSTYHDFKSRWIFDRNRLHELKRVFIPRIILTSSERSFPLSYEGGSFLFV